MDDKQALEAFSSGFCAENDLSMRALAPAAVIQKN